MRRIVCAQADAARGGPLHAGPNSEHARYEEREGGRLDGRLRCAYDKPLIEGKLPFRAYRLGWSPAEDRKWWFPAAGEGRKPSCPERDIPGLVFSPAQAAAKAGARDG